MGFQIPHVEVDMTSADQFRDVLTDPVRNPTRRVPQGKVCRKVIKLRRNLHEFWRTVAVRDG